MKPNRKYFVVTLALFSVVLFSANLQAQTTHGKFTLPIEARWGTILLEPGEYDFTITNDLAGPMLTLRSRETRLAAMVLSAKVTDLRPDGKTKLILEKSDMGMYVRALCLGDAGVMLTYEPPKSSKVTRLMQPPAAVASASGVH